MVDVQRPRAKLSACMYGVWSFNSSAIACLGRAVCGVVPSANKLQTPRAQGFSRVSQRNGICSMGTS